MRNKITILVLILFSFLLFTCNQINEKDISGEWIITTALYNGKNIPMATKSIKIIVLPVGYEDKFTITFDLRDSTSYLPGINTVDIPCKWKISEKKLIISFDTTTYLNSALVELDSLKTLIELKHDSNSIKQYSYIRDSILKTKSIDSLKIPLNIYLGTYNIEKVNHGLILTSPKTKFELINSDYVFKRDIDNMFQTISPHHLLH